MIKRVEGCGEARGLLQHALHVPNIVEQIGTDHKIELLAQFGSVGVALDKRHSG